MEACIAVPSFCHTYSAKKSLNPPCPTLHSTLPNPHRLSSYAHTSFSSSSVIHGQKSRSVKPLRALSSSTSRGGGGGVASPVGFKDRSVSLPRFEDIDATNMLLRQRIVFLCSEVNDINADFVISQLLLLDAEDKTKDIKFFINSPGGSVTAGMGIYDAMKLCKADVSTICFGLAASMGAFLLAAGTKGKRFCMPNSKVMIHQPYGGRGGGVVEMGLQARELRYHKKKFEKIYSRITGKSEKQIEDDTSHDYFLNAWEALGYGIVDAVIDDGKPGLVAPIGDSTYPPKFGLWHYHALYDRIKPLPSEENLIKKEFDGARESSEEVKGDSSGEKDSKKVKERKQFVYDIPIELHIPS
uniref:ATP-dependent Clp protease proteolytic subunit n=1 Tax=Wollemia nobilis TaxID=56998 RepID=A0A0C9QP17_9CONI